MRRPGAAYCCGTCGDVPYWTVRKVGAPIVTWACETHLHALCEARVSIYAQSTEFVITHYPDQAGVTCPV